MTHAWDADTATAWWRSATLRGRILCAIVVVQFVFPLVALSMERPTRFGFQMYSGYGNVDLWVVDATGRRRAVEMDDVAVSHRGEIDWSEHMPAFLCATERSAVSATVEQHGEIRTVSCKP